MTRRLLIKVWIVWTVCLAGATLSAPRAAKLVFLHNGRVIRAQEALLSDGWYKLTLGKRSTIVLPVALIDEVTEVEDGGRGGSLPNVQKSAGAQGGGMPVNRAARPSMTPPVRAVARPTGAAVTPPQAGTPSRVAQDARARAEALAARGRTLGADLTGRRNIPGSAGSPDLNTPPPVGTDLTGGSSSWPSILEKDRNPRQRGNGRRGGRGDDNR